MASYTIENQKEFEDLLRRIAKSGSNRFIMGEMARIVKKFSRANFILKGSGQYPPLQERYRKRKARIRPSAPILVFDGDLKDSIIGKTSDSILKITKNVAIVGTKVAHAKVHDEGFSGTVTRKTKSGKSVSYQLNIPQRKPLFLTTKMVEQMIKTYAANIDKGLRTL